MTADGLSLVKEVRVVTAHCLVQRLMVNGQEHRVETYFVADDEEELLELCQLWQEGQADKRLVEVSPPNEVWEQRPKIETVAFCTPNGLDVLKDYREALGIPE